MRRAWLVLPCLVLTPGPAAQGQVKELHRLEGHADVVEALAFSPKGKVLASASADPTVILWNVQTGQHLATLRGHTKRVRACAFSPDGRMLASGSEDKTIRLWEVMTHKERATIKQSTAVGPVAFHPNGKLLAAAVDVALIN
jgi:WD40 repeat protein